MAWLGFGGNKLIAQTLARAGWKISQESVRRIRKEPPPTYADTHEVNVPKPRSVKARYPGHIWMADLTEVPGLFGIFRFKIAVVLDVFSRLPLSFSVFTKEPTAQDIRILFLRAMARFRIPRHFVSDKGRQFIDSGFRQFLFGLGVQQRFGAVGKTGSIAIIERFWKQLKYTLSLRSFPPFFQDDFERRLESWLFFYTNFRPHQGLAGATPSEVFLRQKPARLYAVHPPRGKPREGPTDIPFEIRFVDSERRLPVLVAKAA
jgi:transposase InsO family protein